MAIAEPQGSDYQRIHLFGASGTIGRATADALLADGHAVTCFLRRSAAAEGLAAELIAAGAACRFGDVTDPGSIAREGFVGEGFDTVISCLALR